MQIIVNPHTLTINKTEIVNEGEYNIQSCNFQFSDEFSGLSKIAVFTGINGSYKIALSSDTCIIPIEVLQNEEIITVGVYAYDVDGEELVLRYSPTPDVFTVEPGSYIENAQNSSAPTPTEVEQLQSQITDNANNIETLQETTSEHTSQISDIEAEQKTQNNNIETNTNDISNIKDEQTTQNDNIAQNTADITRINNNLANYSLITETGSQILLSINSDYELKATLKDKNGNVIYESNEIDLPIESMIINATYDSTTKEIVFTLQNGNVLRVSVADLVSGLVSTDELSTILANYYTKSEINTLLSTKANSDNVYTKSETDTLLSGKVDTTTYTAGQNAQDENISENTSNIEEIQNLINQFPTVSGTGTNISLQDVLNYRFIKLMFNGNASQNGTPKTSSPIPINVVTGENTLTISNIDNTEIQNYPITLGNLEFISSSDGTIRDYIYGTPNNWYKKKCINKVILNGNEGYGKNASGTGFISFTISDYINIIDHSVSDDIRCNMLSAISSGNVANTCRIASSGRIVVTFEDTFCNYDLTALSNKIATLYNNGTPIIIYFPLATPTDEAITDTTLITQLNNIYNNAHSYNGTTNITTTYASGNEQMYLDVEALQSIESYVSNAISGAITDSLGGDY